MTAFGDDRVHERALMLRLQQGGGQPRGSVSVKKLAGLLSITCPEHIALGRTWPVVDDDQLREVLSQERRIPKATRGNRRNREWRSPLEIGRGLLDPFAKRQPIR